MAKVSALVGSIANLRQGIPLRLQNSYRLESKNPFNRDQVETILKEVMDNHFSQYDRFDTRTSVDLCMTVTEDVMSQVKEKHYDR